MKPTIKQSLAVLGAGSATALALFGWSAASRESAAFHLANGVEVTPLENQSDSALDLLDAKIWKFDVMFPDNTRQYVCTLYQYRHGKVVAPLGGIGSGPVPGEKLPRHMPLTVCMVPTDGTFSAAHQVKYSIRVYGAGSSGTFPNPFGHRLSYTWTPQAQPSGNSIYLMSGSKNGVYGMADENDAAIALRIEPTIN